MNSFLFNRSDGLCESCGRPAQDKAHIEPKMMGGHSKFKAFYDDNRNLAASCRTCHTALDQRKEGWMEILEKFKAASGWNAWAVEAISKGIILRNKVML
jgi:hypothetical protein